MGKPCYKWQFWSISQPFCWAKKPPRSLTKWVLSVVFYPKCPRSKKSPLSLYQTEHSDQIASHVQLTLFFCNINQVSKRPFFSWEEKLWKCFCQSHNSFIRFFYPELFTCFIFCIHPIYETLLEHLQRDKGCWSHNAPWKLCDPKGYPEQLLVMSYWSKCIIHFIIYVKEMEMEFDFAINF